MLMCIIVLGILTMDKGTCKELTVLKNDPKPQSLNVGLAGEEWQEQIDLGLSKSLQYTSNQTKLTYHSGLALKRIKEVAAFLEHSHFSCWGRGEIWNQRCSPPSSEQLAPSSQHVDVCVWLYLIFSTYTSAVHCVQNLLWTSYSLCNPFNKASSNFQFDMN